MPPVDRKVYRGFYFINITDNIVSSLGPRNRSVI